jgi:signal transduction histidine kinase
MNSSINVFKSRSSLLVMGIFCCLAFFNRAYGQSGFPRARAGVIDLRQVDLQNSPVPLDGEWVMYWGKLLTPGDSLPAARQLVKFPELWRYTTADGRHFPDQGYATYALTVLLPRHTDSLALQLYNTYTSYRVFVNNIEVASAGHPGTTDEATVPQFVDRTAELMTTADTLHLLMQIANFRHSKGGPNKTIFIGDRTRLIQKRKQEDFYDILLAGCLFMTGLFFFGLYLFGRRDRSILYFSLFAIAYSYRIVGANTYVLQSIYPGMEWSLGIHLEYLSLLISIIFFSVYTRALYPKEAGKYLVPVQLVFCLSLVAMVLVFPPIVFTSLLNIFLIVMFGLVICAFYVYFKAFRNKRVGANFALMSTAVLLVVFILIIFQYFELIRLPRIVLFGGYLSFFFLQSLILLFRFTHALNKAISELGQQKKIVEDSNAALQATISELNATQAQLIQSEKMASLGELTAGIAHEIQNPLNFVNNFSEVNIELIDEMKAELSGGNTTEAIAISEDIRKNLGKINHHGKRADSIVKNMLLHSRKRTGQREPTDINALADEYIRLSYHGLRAKDKTFNAAIHTRFDETIGEVSVVPQDIGRMLLNLYNNAFYAVQQKAKSAGPEYQPAVTLMTRKEGSKVLITISDNGTGIPDSVKEKIFQPFFTTKPAGEGTGLGLSMSYDIVKAHGGEMVVRSVAGEGSEFIIQLRSNQGA